MEQKLMVITAEGKEILFDAGSNVNFSHDHLLITIQSPSSTGGFYWDQFAGLIQTSDAAVETPSKITCRALLRFENGREKTLEVTEFQKIDLTLDKNIIQIIGKKAKAIINLDFFQWYRIHR